MSKEEKILLVQLLLEDIRSNWGWENNNRREFALCLAKELNDVQGMDILAYSIESYEHGDDGRYFRDIYPHGYEGMSSLHGLEKTFNDKSDKFKSVALDYLTYPEYSFSDYEVK